MKEPTDDKPPGLSRVQRRLIEPAESDELLFQHTVFCQTGLPYRDPGDDVRTWKRTNGAVALQVEAGSVWNPAVADFVQLGLPWGTKPRLILTHLNAEALRQGSPIIEIEGSLSAFVRRIRGFKHGREIRAFKDQLNRLANSAFRLAVNSADKPEQRNIFIIENFKLWPEKDERQRVLWPAVVEFHPNYFANLQRHAVPLREADLAALAHSAMALDIYAWLAQRLHRIEPRRAVFVPWQALRLQFGAEYQHMFHFRAEFRTALRRVLARYSAARIESEAGGMILRNSAPPVPGRLVQLTGSCS